MSLEIRLRESEFRFLLHRESAIESVKRAFEAQIVALEDMTNYGTNLIPRCFTSSQRQLKDVVVISILLRQAVAMLDAAQVLMSQGAIHAAALQARALLEASVYIDWILQAETEKKAVYYYVHNLRRQRLWSQRAHDLLP